MIDEARIVFSQPWVLEMDKSRSEADRDDGSIHFTKFWIRSWLTAFTLTSFRSTQQLGCHNCEIENLCSPFETIKNMSKILLEGTYEQSSHSGWRESMSKQSSSSTRGRTNQLHSVWRIETPAQRILRRLWIYLRRLLRESDPPAIFRKPRIGDDFLKSLLSDSGPFLRLGHDS